MGALVFVVLILCGGLGGVLGQPKGLLGLGVALGFLLGPIGVVVVLLMNDAPHVARAKQASPGRPIASVEDQFRSLDDLVARGVITSAERDAARASLLAAPMAPAAAIDAGGTKDLSRPAENEARDDSLAGSVISDHWALILASIVLFIVIALALALAACSGGPSQADGDRACQSAEVCQRYGACWYNPKTYMADTSERFGSPRWIGSTGVHNEQCEARSDQDCAQSDVCRLLGQCYVRRDGEAVSIMACVESDAARRARDAEHASREVRDIAEIREKARTGGCERYCAVDGRCSRSSSATCVAILDLQCKQSEACKREGRCVARDGECQR